MNTDQGQFMNLGQGQVINSGQGQNMQSQGQAMTHDQGQTMTPGSNQYQNNGRNQYDRIANDNRSNNPRHRSCYVCNQLGHWSLCCPYGQQKHGDGPGKTFKLIEDMSMGSDMSQVCKMNVSHVC